MHRDIEQLRNGPFDVLVIGGGVYGAWMACHAARSGLRVTLVDRSDWAAATSSSSSKLLHGGLRYLENLEFRLVRKSLKERRELHRLMPHHVRPLRFLVPVYRHSRVGRWQLKAGLWLYDRLAGRHQPVGPHESLSVNRLRQREPRLNQQDLTHGFSYGDCGTDDARMVLEIVDSAMAAGAAVANYVTAVELLNSGSRVSGARLRDEESGETFEVRASLVINASGPWVFQHAGLEGYQSRVRLTKGVHLVMPALPSGQAVLLTSQRDGRVFFLIPWYGRTLLGTTDTDFEGDPAAIAVEPSDVSYLLNSANDYLETNWTTNDIHSTYVGLRTLRNEAGKSASRVSRDWEFEETIPGLYTSLGGKYTSARIDALEAVERMTGILQRSNGNSTPDKPLAWYPGESFEGWKADICGQAQSAGMDAETADCCARRHGSQFTRLLELIANDASLSKRIVADLPFCRAEVVHAVTHEMARTLMDVLRRRIPLLLLTRLDAPTVDDVCQIAGDAAGWDASRREEETAAVLKHVWQLN